MAMTLKQAYQRAELASRMAYSQWAFNDANYGKEHELTKEALDAYGVANSAARAATNAYIAGKAKGVKYANQGGYR